MYFLFVSYVVIIITNYNWIIRNISLSFELFDNIDNRNNAKKIIYKLLIIQYNQNQILLILMKWL